MEREGENRPIVEKGRGTEKKEEEKKMRKKRGGKRLAMNLWRDRVGGRKAQREASEGGGRKGKERSTALFIA